MLFFYLIFLDFIFCAGSFVTVGFPKSDISYRTIGHRSLTYISDSNAPVTCWTGPFSSVLNAATDRASHSDEYVPFAQDPSIAMTCSSSSRSELNWGTLSYKVHQSVCRASLIFKSIYLSCKYFIYWPTYLLIYYLFFLFIIYDHVFIYCF